MAAYYKDSQGRQRPQIAGQIVIGGQVYDYTSLTFEPGAELEECPPESSGGHEATIDVEVVEWNPSALEPPQ